MLKSTHKPIRNYHAALANAGEPIEVAFKHLLEAAAAAWKGQIVVLNTNDFQQNGFITDEYGLSIGTWIHSKTHQEVAVFFAAEIAKEANLLIHQNGEFLHFSKGKLKNGADGHDGIAVVDILELFFNFTPAYFEAWQQVAQYYQTQLPVIERNLLKALPIARKEEVFSRKFKAFLQLCQSVLSRKFSTKQVDFLLVQHLLTQPLSAQGFASGFPPENNLLLWEMEQIWQSLPKETLLINDIQSALFPFYNGISQVLTLLSTDIEKNYFIQTVCQHFFSTQIYQNPPQEIIQFLCKSANYLVQRKGLDINEAGFPIVDLFAGEGAVMSEFLGQFSTQALPYKYNNEIFCNEINLINYHICTAKIKQVYTQRTHRKDEFKGLCWVDSAVLAEPFQATLFNEKNTSRIERVRQSHPKLIIGEIKENISEEEIESSPILSKRVTQTYLEALPSAAKTKDFEYLFHALRLATDIIAHTGTIALIIPHIPLNKIIFSGLKKHLIQDFDRIHCFDLGNLVQSEHHLPYQLLFLEKDRKRKGVYYAQFPTHFTIQDKLDYLNKTPFPNIEWQKLKTDAKWELGGKLKQYQDFIPLFHQENLSIFKRIWNLSDAQKSESENRILCTNFQPEFSVWTSNGISSVDFSDSLIFPFYYIHEETGLPKPSISDETVAFFRSYYNDPEIHRWGIWHYVYAILHHPNYRKRFAAHLSESLPRIPLADRFFAWSEIGKTLAGIHLSIKQLQVYPLDFQVKGIPKLPENVKEYKVLGQSLISCATGGKKIATSFRKPLGQWATMALETKRIVGGMDNLGLYDGYGEEF